MPGHQNLAQVYGISQTVEFCVLVTSLRWFIIKVLYCSCPFVVNSFYWYAFFLLTVPIRQLCCVCLGNRIC